MSLIKISKSVSPHWVAHKEQWSSCTRCPLYENAHLKVFARGSVPCDVLFIGEAPGKDENLRGYPFVGKAGSLLNKLIEDSFEIYGEYRYAITNVVACLPITEEGKLRPPEPLEVKRCDPRLRSFIDDIAHPSKIICLGRVATTHLDEADLFPQVYSLVHPAWVLRQGGVSSEAYRQTLKNLVSILKLS